MESKQDQLNAQAVSRAWLLTLAGFIPFGILSIVIFVIGSEHGLFSSLFDLFKTYGAVILSFLGGIRWGFAIAYEPFDKRSLTLSVVPSLLGWFALLLPDQYAVLVLLLGFCAQGAWDSFYINAGNAPPWFGRLRITITFLVAIAHILVFFAVAGSSLTSSV